MRFISNEEFNEALLNEQYKRVSYAALKKSKLTVEEKREIYLESLWLALSEFDNLKGMKFTTYLVERVKWAMYSLLKSKKTTRLISNIEIMEIPKVYPTTLISEIDSLLSVEDSEIIKQYFVENMTLSEIGQSLGISKQAISMKVKHACEKLRKKISR